MVRMAAEMTHLRIVSLLAVVACGGAQSEPAEPKPGPAPGEPAAEPDAVEAAPEEPAESRIVARNFDVAPGKFAEVNFELESGSDVTAAFRADGDVQWNVHSHPADGVAIHQEGAGSDGKISFHAETQGGYSYLWTNKGEQTVNLLISIEMPAGARNVSWVPEDQ